MSLDAFHRTAAALDFEAPLRGLLDEFRAGRIADRGRLLEEDAVRRHLGELAEAWDAVLPGFPPHPWKRRTIRWEHHRGERDAYLRDLVVRYVAEQGEREGRACLVVNPATVFGRHARALAKALPGHRVVATDVDWRGDLEYRWLVAFWKYPGLDNYRFERESVFDADLSRRADAVVFFGACGAVTDGAMDYALGVKAPLLVCRSCCHDNIAGNTRIERRPGCLNAFFAFKNRGYARYKKKDIGFYFDRRYGRDAYPRSRAARALMDGETILAVARSSPDSDVCRSVIDLDRCLYLRENGYDVLYREELFFAHRPAAGPYGAGAPAS